MTGPLVSVIMPVYNTERFLQAAIASVCAQTYQNWELLLVNDESPGNVREIAAGLADSRIRYLEHKNAGPAFTRNRGMRESCGEFLAFLDSDDVWSAEKLEKQMKIFMAEPETGVVYSQRDTIDEHGRPCPGYRPLLFSGMILDRLYVDNCVCMSSAVMRRTVLDRVGYLDETLTMSEDFEYWLRVACFFPFSFVDEPLVHYRIHGAQVSRKTEIRVETVWEIRKRFDREWGSCVGFRARRQARALHLSHKAYRSERVLPRYAAFFLYLRALGWNPLDGFSWRGLARTLTPAWGAALYRRLRQ